MKVIKYKLDETTEITLAYNEINEASAAKNAYNGEYTIEDDGQPEMEAVTTEQRIADLEEALAMLLSGVTE